MIGSDFIEQTAKYKRYCSECNRPILVGEKYLASIKDGKVKKTVCGEECRLVFDDRVWQGFARRNAKAHRPS